jgi:hypothetical protein
MSILLGISLATIPALASSGGSEPVESTTASACAPATGLIGHWPLNGDATDTSGNGNNGVIVGATVINTGVSGGSAFHFDGSSYIDVGDLQFPNSTFTVSVWVKSQTEKVINTFRSPIAKLEDGSTGGPFEIFDGFDSTLKYVGPGAITWHGGISGPDLSVATLTLKADGRWHMVTYAYQLGHQSLYVDGAVVKYGNDPGPLPTTTAGVRIGGYSFGPYHHPWIGSVDEVLIYSRVLSNVEILKMYQCIVPPPL